VITASPKKSAALMIPSRTIAPAAFVTPRCANAISASVPPSPWLSARSRNTTYLSVTTTISAHRIDDSTPSTASGEASLPALAATTASRKA